MSIMCPKGEKSSELDRQGNAGKAWKQFITTFVECGRTLSCRKVSPDGSKRIGNTIVSRISSTYHVNVPEKTTKEIRLSKALAPKTINLCCGLLWHAIFRAGSPPLLWKSQNTPVDAVMTDLETVLVDNSKYGDVAALTISLCPRVVVALGQALQFWLWYLPLLTPLLPASSNRHIVSTQTSSDWSKRPTNFF